MLMAVVVVPPGEISSARAAMRGLLLAGQRRVHTSDESDRRRHLILDTIARTDGLAVTVLRYRRSEGVTKPAARRVLLQAATGLVIASGVTAWILDDQEPAQQSRDRSAITHVLAGIDRVLRPTFDHRPSRQEPLLWAADAVCWAVGAGNEWRQRVQAVLSVRDIGP